MQILERKDAKRHVWYAKQECTGRDHGYDGCGSLLLVDEADVFYSSFSGLLSKEALNYTFRCPVCGACTDLIIRDVATKKHLDRCIKRRYATREIDTLEGNRG